MVSYRRTQFRAVRSLYNEQYFVSIGFDEKVFVLLKIQRKRCLMGFKERLKEKRVEAGLTQVELAKKAGVTARTINSEL